MHGENLLNPNSEIFNTRFEWGATTPYIYRITVYQSETR